MDDHKKKSSSHENDRPLKELCSVWGPAEAEVIKAFLESQGITCLFRGRVVQSIYPFSADGLGQIKIFVLEKDYETAKELLSQIPKPQEVDDFEKNENDH